jgi:glycosyltransferase involved in cell wall biosynthesis
MTRVCFVAPNLYPVLARRADIPVVGGAEVQQNFIARSLQKCGFEVVAVCEDFGQPNALTIDGIQVIKTFRANEGTKGVRAVHPRMTKLWRALKQANADVYYVRCAAMTMGLVAAFCRLNGRKCVFAGASDLDFQPGQELIRAPWYRWMFRWGLTRADAIVAQNPNQVDSVRKHYGREAQLVRSMFVPEVLPSALSPAREVVWCGVLREAKRVEVFVELARRLPSLNFRIIGGPDGSAYSQAKAQTLQSLSAQLPNLSYAGFLPYEAADTLISQAWALCNTSASEGFPNTFLQAWSRGIPTLSFVDVGATLGGARVGRVCNDVDAMELVLREWQTNADIWSMASQRSSQYFQAAHSEQAVIRAYTELLSRLVSVPQSIKA